ncbi:hypothetical protein CLV63_12034 [Murinocardiopsis flavida]|uniref:DUF5067 domain-containing protein n=1 Tax=Murinocardiopsis flavida TaxID=645275 RepID=A0A2P8D270_9ACTN|nr:glycosyl hydrolase 43 family protein [Murinocardiopsis flavida]PSK91308.1 hypothetical protein CLV63_12034 [Murinocardiopsis flavida]
MKHKLSAMLALVALLTASLSASASADGSASQTGKLPVLGKAEFTGEMSANAGKNDAKATVEVNSLKRAKDGELTTLMYTVRNEHESESYPLTAWSASPTYTYAPIKSMSGAVLDTNEKIRYHNLTDEKFYCFCSNTNGTSTADVIEAGSHGVVWGSFLIPKEVKSVTVRVPGFSAIKDVPIN